MRRPVTWLLWLTAFAGGCPVPPAPTQGTVIYQRTLAFPRTFDEFSPTAKGRELTITVAASRSDSRPGLIVTPEDRNVTLASVAVPASPITSVRFISRAGPHAFAISETNLALLSSVEALGTLFYTVTIVEND
jgi:hypothetical protein